MKDKRLARSTQDSENVKKDKLDEESIEFIVYNKTIVNKKHKYTEEGIDNNIKLFLFQHRN
jgi:hypothetical protein